MRSENFVVIHGWMRNELELKGNDLMVYAVIYGFSQTDNQKFTGSLQYLADWCGATKQGIMKNLKNLLERNLIVKEEHVVNGVKLVDYYATQFNGVYNSVERGIQLSCINNIEDNKEDNKGKSNSKELLQNSDFQFGKQKKSVKKDNLFTKCVSLIDSYDFACWGNIRKLLIDYLNYRISVKDKPLYTNMWKGMLNKLVELCDDDIRMYEQVIKQSIERGYLSFYPVSSGSGGSIKNESGARHVPRMTKQDYEDEERRLAELEAKGVQVRF